MGSEKWFFRTIAVENAFELCSKFLDEVVTVREFTSGNKKLSARDYGFESKSLKHLKSRFTKSHFTLSVSELYDLTFIAFYEQEMEKRQRGNRELRIVTDIEDAAANDDQKREEFFCDGAIAFGDTPEDGYMPIQHVKVISFELKDAVSIEEEAIEQMRRKEAKRAKYPPICALVVSIIADRSNINYKNILNKVKNTGFQRIYFIEHHKAMREATVISIDSSTMKADRNSFTIRPRLITKSRI